MAGLAMNSLHSSSLPPFSIEIETHHFFPSSSSLHFFKVKENVRNKRLPVSCKLSGTELEERVKQLKQTQTQNRAKIKKRVPLRPGRISGPLSVPAGIPKPSYAGSTELPELSRSFQIHDSEGVSGIKAACQLAARALDFAGSLIRPSITTNEIDKAPSVTTNEIDKAVHKMIIENEAYPSLLGFCNFPKSISTSINECVSNGIPDSRQIQNGDTVTIDVAVFLNGYHGSTSKTFICGDVDELVKRFIKVSEQCLERGISSCKDGTLFRKIGKKISEHAWRYDYNIVDRFVGHGIGSILHSEPLILHHSNDKPGRMVEGQTFTIGPILTMGNNECITWDNGWTTVTSDGSLAAKFEHTVLITKTGFEILTKL